jgi:hypothetical protein
VLLVHFRGYFNGSVFITAKDAKGAKEGMEGIDENLLRALRVLRGLISWFGFYSHKKSQESVCRLKIQMRL